MGHIILKDENSVTVEPQSTEELAALTSAFAASLGSDKQTFEAGKNDFTVSIDNLSNIVALRACGITLDANVLEAIIDKLMPIVQRQAMFDYLKSETDSIARK